MIPLAKQAHTILRQILKPGEMAIDATAGNGHDTLFLAQLVGEDGSVFAFDIQADALNTIESQLNQADLFHVNLLHEDHVRMKKAIPKPYHGKIGAIMFNLGYLPGGDKSITTQPHSTLLALQASLDLLRPNGVISIIAYTAHSGGLEESNAVMEWVEALPKGKYAIQVIESEPGKNSGPRLIVVRKHSGNE